MRNFGCLVLAGLTLLVGEALFGASLQALPYGAGTYGSCQYSSCSISLNTSGTINLGVTPTSGGVYTTLSDEVEVETHSSTGYTLTLLDSDTNTSLVNGGDTVAASSGTQASPIALAMNTWGYRIDNLAGFGAGPTSAQSNEPSSSYIFAGIPASNQTAHTLKTTSVAADPAETTTVWYGVRIDSTKPSGSYSDQVTYTATIND